jgi:hypothetical protein
MFIVSISFSQPIFPWIASLGYRIVPAAGGPSKMIPLGGQSVSDFSIRTHVWPPGRDWSARCRDETLASVNRTRATRMKANLIPLGSVVC